MKFQMNLKNTRNMPKTKKEELKPFFITFGMASPAADRFCKIIAPSYADARVVAHVTFDKWSFIYNQEQFEGQPEKYGLTPTPQSPIEVQEYEMWHYHQKFKEMQEES